MKNLILLLSIFASHSGFSQNNNIENIVSKTLDKINAHQSITYDLFFISKMYWGLDTTETFSTCSVIRNDEDEFAGGYSQLFISNDENKADNGDIIQRPSQEYVYDGEILTTQFIGTDYRNLSQDNARDLGSIPNNGLLHQYFLRPTFLQNLLKDAVYVEETSFKQHSCYHIRITKEPSDKYRDQQIDMWINQETFDIVRIVEQFQYQNMDGFQYDEWQFDIESYDKITKADILKRRDAILQENNDYRYLRTKEDTKALIHPNETAPDLFGWSVFEEREVSLLEYSSAPVVLYFWDADLITSMNGLEYINNLSAEYAPFGIVFLGVTSNQMVLSKRMKEFLNNESTKKLYEDKNIPMPEEGMSISTETVLKILNLYHTNFSNIMVNPSILDDYGVIGYPEIVLLDEAGKVIFSSYGLNDANKNELKIELEKLID